MILGLDISSTRIGWCVMFEPERATIPQAAGWGTIGLTSDDIARRCLAAQGAIRSILGRATISRCALEAPASPHKKSLIPQCRVQGVVLAALAEARIAYVELAPQLGKVALTGRGDASKSEMITAAAAQLRIRLTAIVERQREWFGIRDGDIVLTEHDADAYGIARALIAPAPAKRAAKKTGARRRAVAKRGAA